jgi:HAD superfamily hydrolase (TIGR01549 family)
MHGHVRGVIFDVDGTLLDSNDAHARAWVDALNEAGIDASYERVRPLIGMGGDKILSTLAGIEENKDDAKRISERRIQILMEEYFPGVRAFAGGRALLERLRRAGLKLAIASSAKKEELDALLDRAGVKDLIDVATSSGDVEKTKPDPDIIEAALKRLALPPDQVLMVGDTPYDVKAGSRAGVRVIAVRSGGWSDEALKGAIGVYDNVADMLAHFDELPIEP